MIRLPLAQIFATVLAMLAWCSPVRAYEASDVITYDTELVPGGDRASLSFPMGAAIDDQGYIYVADTSAHRIVAFRRNGDYMESFGSQGSGPGQFYYPHGLSVGDLPNGARGLYVVDGGNHRVQVFTPDGHLERLFGTFGSGPGQLNTPAAIATLRGVPGAGVWVADGRNNRIVQFTISGSFVKSVDCAKCFHGLFAVPVGLALRKTADGYLIYVSEENAHRVRVLTPDGKELDTIGSFGTNDGELWFPDDIAIDEGGSLFVVESGNQRVSIFDPDGNFVRSLKQARPLSQEGFISPHGVATGPRGRLVVVATGMNQAFAYKVKRPTVGISNAVFDGLQGNTPRMVFGLVYNDLEKYCDISFEIAFEVTRRGQQTSFVRSGPNQRVEELKFVRVPLTLDQAALVNGAKLVKAQFQLRAKCGNTRISNTIDWRFD